MFIRCWCIAEKKPWLRCETLQGEISTFESLLRGLYNSITSQGSLAYKPLAELYLYQNQVQVTDFQPDGTSYSTTLGLFNLGMRFIQSTRECVGNATIGYDLSAQNCFKFIEANGPGVGAGVVRS